MSISVDAREVLSHLNALGYRNVTAEQLKEFMKDLKKLIKYETRIEAVLSMRQQQHIKDSTREIFNKLHEQKTASIDAKYAKHDRRTTRKGASSPEKHKPTPVLKEINTNRAQPNITPRTHSGRSQAATGKVTTARTKSNERKSTMDSERRAKTPKSSRKSRSESSLDRKENRMWIRPRITQPQAPRTKDSVELYQFYQKQWERFKQQMPGENDHSELRWKIRHKLLGCG